MRCMGLLLPIRCSSRVSQTPRAFLRSRSQMAALQPQQTWRPCVPLRHLQPQHQRQCQRQRQPLYPRSRLLHSPPHRRVQRQLPNQRNRRPAASLGGKRDRALKRYAVQVKSEAANNAVVRKPTRRHWRIVKRWVRDFARQMSWRRTRPGAQDVAMTRKGSGAAQAAPMTMVTRATGPWLVRPNLNRKLLQNASRQGKLLVHTLVAAHRSLLLLVLGVCEGRCKSDRDRGKQQSHDAY